MDAIGDPASDREGLSLSAHRERARTKSTKELDSDF
jgi:hypothetical protein